MVDYNCDNNLQWNYGTSRAVAVKTLRICLGCRLYNFIFFKTLIETTFKRLQTFQNTCEKKYKTILGIFLNNNSNDNSL